MKVLEMVNDEGVKRYYSGFYCKPLILCCGVSYAVKAEYFDCIRGIDFVDCLRVYDNATLAMEYCVELTKQLEAQPDCSDVEDPILYAYFYQCKRLEDDSNDNNGK